MKKGKKQVIIIKADPLERSPHLFKVFNTLTEAGFEVTVLCWNREKDVANTSKNSENSSIKRNMLEFNIKTPFGFSSIPFLILWWCYVFLKLVKFSRWQIAHVINFPSLFPTLLICKITRKPLIYEILDSPYADQIVMPKILRNIFLEIERFFTQFPDVIIIVDELQIQEFRGIPNKKVVVIYDSPPDVSKMLSKLSITGKDSEVFELFYAGVLYKQRKLNLEKIIEAIRGLNGIKLLIAGYGDMVEEIIKWCSSYPDKVQYIGRLNYEQVLEESMKAHLLFVLRDPIVPVNRYICGSKFLEATMCGKPILVNKKTSTAIKVIRSKCGFAVDANDVGEVRDTILKLKNDQKLCKMLGVNGRKAYEQKYGWSVMKQRLLDLYSKLLA